MSPQGVAGVGRRPAGSGGNVRVVGTLTRGAGAAALRRPGPAAALLALAVGLGLTGGCTSAAPPAAHATRAESARTRSAEADPSPARPAPLNVYAHIAAGMM